MADELIDVYDENNHPLGIKKMKSEAHKDGLWHRASHIWVYNFRGEILLQLRAKEKPYYPDLWDISAAGHVIAGEDPATSGLRETEEEIGLKIKKEDLQFFKIKKASIVYKKIRNNEFYYVYFLRFDGNIKKLKIQEEELQEIRFFPIKEIEEELRTDPSRYVPHKDYWFEAIEEVKKRLEK